MSRLRLCAVLLAAATPLTASAPAWSSEKDLVQEVRTQERQVERLESQVTDAELDRRTAALVVKLYNPVLEVFGAPPLTVDSLVKTDVDQVRSRYQRASRGLERTEAKLERLREYKAQVRREREEREKAEAKARARARHKAKVEARRARLEERRLAKEREREQERLERERARQSRTKVAASSYTVNSVTTPSAKVSEPSSALKSSRSWNCRVPSGDPHTKGWPRRMRTRVDLQFDPSAIGGYRHGDPQDHGKGLALDVMVPVRSAKGDAVASWATKNMDRLNITYVIWRQRIYGEWDRRWRKMENRGSVTANHYDHVHISFDGRWGSCPRN